MFDFGTICRLKKAIRPQIISRKAAVPIYEYQCDSCSHRLEKLQKMSDAPLTECPACGASTLKKLVSAAAFRLKRRLVRKPTSRLAARKMYPAAAGSTAPVVQAVSDSGTSAQQVVGLAHHPINEECPFKFCPDTGFTFDKLSGIPKRDDLGSV